MSDLNRKPLQIWECKIGECPDGSLPNAADCPMRDAVAEAYERISGHKPAFIFSGWNAELTEGERAAHENRLPRDPTPGPLTREPHKYHHPNCSLNATNGPDGDFCNCKMVVDYPEYAALRATIAQQAQEIEFKNKKIKALMEFYDKQVGTPCEGIGHEQKLQDLRQQLAAMTKERDEAIITYTGQVDKAEHGRNRAVATLESVRKELAAAQARCREMEQVEKQREEAGWVSRSYMDEALALKDKRLAQLQARVKELEAECKKWQQPFDTDMLKEVEQQASHGDSLAAQRVYITALEHGLKQLQATLAAREALIEQMREDW